MAVRRDVVFATPPAHTVQCCRSSLALAVCTVAMLGTGRGRGSSRDASPAAVAAGEVAAWYEGDGSSDAGADVAGNARAAVAAQAEPHAEVDRQRQFAIFVPMDYRNREFLEALPWQSIAVVSYKQEPFNSRVIRCMEGGDTYQVFFDCTMLACPGTRPTVVGRTGVVEDGYVVDVVEKPCDGGLHEAEFAFHCATVQLEFGRMFAGMSECRLTVVAFGDTLSAADGVKIAVAILAAAPNVIVITRGSELRNPVWVHAYVVDAALKLYGAAFLWHTAREDNVFCSMQSWNGGHCDVHARDAYHRMQGWSEAGDMLPDVSDAAVAASIRQGSSLPRMKVKNYKDAAVVAWFGTGSRTAAAEHTRKLKAEHARKCKKPRRG